jgi:hypothetical protein
MPVHLLVERIRITMPQPEEISLDSTIVVVSDQIASQLGEESVILNLNDGMYYGLDPIGTRIWQLLEQPRGVREICALLQDEYDVATAECENEVLSLVRELNGRGLVEIRQ